MRKYLLILFLLIFLTMGYSVNILGAGITAEIIQPLLGIEVVQDIKMLNEEINQYQTVFKVTSNSHYSYQINLTESLNAEENVEIVDKNNLIDLIFVDFTLNTEEISNNNLYEMEFIVEFE